MLIKHKSYNNIFIMGMPGSGKSRFGYSYAVFTGKEFIDFDDFFENMFNTQISKVFQSQGLAGFRSMESKALQKLGDKKNHIISLGGGTLLSPQNYDFAHKHGLIVSLVGLSFTHLSQRIWYDKINPSIRPRPLFAKCATIDEVSAKIHELYKERMPVYEKADVILNQALNSTDNLMLTLKYAEQKFDKKRMG